MGLKEMIDPRLIAKLGPHFWQKLYFFYYVAHFKSLSQAATHLNVGKSSISKALQALEYRFKTVLIHRETRCLTLTEPGQSVFDCVKKMLSTTEQIQKLLERSVPLKVFALTLVVPEWILCDYLVGPLNQFGQDCLTIKLEIKIDEKIENSTKIKSGVNIQLGLISNPSFIQKPLLTLESGIYASTPYLNQKGIPLKTSDLSQYQLIGLKTVDPVLFEHMNWHCDRSAEKPRRSDPLLSVHDRASLIKMAKKSSGVIAYIQNHCLISSNKCNRAQVYH